MGLNEFTWPIYSQTQLNNTEANGPGFSHEQDVFQVSMTLGADHVKLLRTKSVGVPRVGFSA